MYVAGNIHVYNHVMMKLLTRKRSTVQYHRPQADLRILRGGGVWAAIIQGGGVRVQVHGNFHILTSKKKKILTLLTCITHTHPPYKEMVDSIILR